MRRWSTLLRHVMLLTRRDEIYLYFRPVVETVVSKNSLLFEWLFLDGPLERALVRPNPLERSCPSPIMEGAIECIALNYAVNSRPVNSAAKGQNAAGLGANHEMLVIDGAFHSA